MLSGNSQISNNPKIANTSTSIGCFEEERVFGFFQISSYSKNAKKIGGSAYFGLELNVFLLVDFE